MRIDDGDRSNVEDRRGSSGGGAGMKLGLGGTLVLLVLSVVFKQDMFSLIGASPMGGAGGGGGLAGAGAAARGGRGGAGEDRGLLFNDTQRTWTQALQGYRPAKLVLYWDQVQSGCGDAAAAMGPFYCPADEKVYIDLGFYRELASRFGAPGQFAQAYVIAHEMGHHLQNVLGIEGKMRQAQQRDPSARNALSVALELQADCFAGVWGAPRRAAQPARRRRPRVRGCNAAAAVGDDRIQKAATGRVNPESFTHGSAAQRSRWFRKGFDTGSLDACDTFGSGEL